MSMLEVQNIHKSFGTTEVLKGIDIQVEKGDVAAILGPSGSGKTTLLRCMNFLEEADDGIMIFDGEVFDLGHMKRRDIARIRRKTAFVFQNYALYPHMSVYENMAFPLKMRKMSKKDIDEKVRQTAEILNLTPSNVGIILLRTLEKLKKNFVMDR